MVIGIYILFNIVSPFIKDNKVLSFDDLNLESYEVKNLQENINQESMDKRLQQLYIEELEKSAIEKLEEEGYKVSKCKIDANLNEDDKNAGIKKIDVKISGKIKPHLTQNENIGIVNKIEW